MKRYTTILATTHVDKHDERLTLEALESLVEQINHQYVLLSVEHDPRIPPIGRVASAKLVRLDDGEYGVEGVVELFETNNSITDAMTDREIAIPAYTGEKILITVDRSYTHDEESQKIIRELQEHAQIEVREEGKKSIEPLSMLTIGIALVVGQFLNGMLAKASADTWDYVKHRISQMLRHNKASNKKSILVYRLYISEPNQQKLIEVVLSNPSPREIEMFHSACLEKIDALVPSLLAAHPLIKKVVLECKMGEVTILYGVRLDGLPMLVDTNEVD